MGRKLSDAEKILIGISTKKEFYNVLDEMLINDRTKKICINYYFNNLTYMEIGDLFGISETTVSREIRSFAIKLAKYIEENR